jgi:hypothetical protein
MDHELSILMRKSNNVTFEIVLRRGVKDQGEWWRGESD